MNKLITSDDKALAGRYWALALLTMVYALSILDRYILSIVLPQIKAEMALRYITGLTQRHSICDFYATLGVPIARLADRSSRKKSLPSHYSLSV